MKYPTNTTTTNSKDPTTAPMIGTELWSFAAEVVGTPGACTTPKKINELSRSLEKELQLFFK